MIKIRSFPDKGYKAIYANGKTIRLGEVKQLDYPEFYDIAINEKCMAGCSYCYVSAIAKGENYPNILDRIENFFGHMTENQRPFQVAIGGHGEPTLHPEFCEVLEKFHSLGITPNYTSNGMHLDEKILEATKKYSGGVAISCHPHLDKVWKRASYRYADSGVKLNLHIIIGEEGSFERFKEIYNEFQDKIEYVVALPYAAVGRAKEIEVESEREKFFSYIQEIGTDKIAFGANFYPYLQKNIDRFSSLGIGMYEPEIMSAYIMFNEDKPIVRFSSYNLNERII